MPARPLDCEAAQKFPPVFNIDSSRRSILRVFNVRAYAGAQMAAPSAVLTPLLLDGGHAIYGASRCVGFIHPGERVDILAELDTEAGHQNSTIQITLDESMFKYENSALSVFHDWPIARTSHPAEQFKSVAVENDDIQLSESLSDRSGRLADHADRTVILYSNDSKACATWK